MYRCPFNENDPSSMKGYTHRCATTACWIAAIATNAAMAMNRNDRIRRIAITTLTISFVDTLASVI